MSTTAFSMATAADWFHAYKLASITPGEPRALVTLRIPYDPSVVDPSAATYDRHSEQWVGDWLAEQREIYPSHMQLACSSTNIMVEKIEELDEFGKKTANQLDIAYSIRNPEFRYCRGKCIDLSQRGSNKPVGLRSSCVFFYLSESCAIFHATVNSAAIRYESMFIVHYTDTGRLYAIESVGNPPFRFGMRENVTKDATNPVYSDTRMNPALVDQAPYRAILERLRRTTTGASLVRVRYPLRERKRVKRYSPIK